MSSLVHMLSEIVQSEIASILSPSSLANDSHLADSLGPDLSVPLSLLLSHARLRDLLAAYASPFDALVANARLVSSVALDLQEERMRPKVHVPRTTVVVRDVSDSEQLHAILNEEISDDDQMWVSQQAPNMWYVRCVSEQVATQLTQELQKKKVHASIKHEPLVRAVFVEATDSQKTIKRYSIEDFSGVSSKPIENLIVDQPTRNLLTNHFHVLK